MLYVEHVFITGAGRQVQTMCLTSHCLCEQVAYSRRVEHDYALGLLLALPPQLAMRRLQRLRARLQSASNYSSVIVSHA